MGWKRGDENSTQTDTKGDPSSKRVARVLADLSICKKVQREKDNAYTLMSLIMLETDQCVEKAEFCIELMT
jgi:hypothetical protein